MWLNHNIFSWWLHMESQQISCSDDGFKNMNPDSTTAPSETTPAPAAPAVPACQMKKRVFVPTARETLAPEAPIAPSLIIVIEEFESYNQEGFPNKTDPLQFW